MIKGKWMSTNKKLPSQHGSFQGFGLASALELGRVGGARQSRLSEMRAREEAVRYVQKLWREEGFQGGRKHDLSGWQRSSEHCMSATKFRKIFYCKSVLWAMGLLSFVLHSPFPLLRMQADHIMKRSFLWMNKRPKILINSALTNLDINTDKILTWMSLKMIILPCNQKLPNHTESNSVLIRSIFFTIITSFFVSRRLWLEKALLLRSTKPQELMHHHCSAPCHCTVLCRRSKQAMAGTTVGQAAACRGSSSWAPPSTLRARC